MQEGTTKMIRRRRLNRMTIEDESHHLDGSRIRDTTRMSRMKQGAQTEVGYAIDLI